jgi:hypothetical protein
VSFLATQYNVTLRANVRERINILRLREPYKYHDCYFLSTFTEPHLAEAPTTDNLFPEEKVDVSKGTQKPDAQNIRRSLAPRHAVVFSVAGSGKSQWLFDYLSINLGHYSVSGRVPSNDASPTSLLNAHRGLASQDTKFLSEVMDSFKPLNTELASILWRCLFGNRQTTLRHFLNCMLNQKGGYTAHDWLVFQTICSGDFDPFLKTFKISAILQCAPIFEHPEWSAEVYAFCLDEMQCEIPESRIEMQDGPMHRLLEEIPRAALDRRNPLIQQHAFIGSGTSLKIFECNNILSGYLRQEAESIRGLDEAARKIPEIVPIGNLKTISKGEEFHSLFHRHIRKLISRMGYLFHVEKTTERYKLWRLLAPGDSDQAKESFYKYIRNYLEKEIKSGRCSLEVAVSIVTASLEKIMCCDPNREENDDKNFQDTPSKVLSDCSLPLRGRIRWSVLFIERIFMKFVEYNVRSATDSHFLTDNIREASQSTEKMIKNQLKARIEELKEKGHHFLVKDLYQTAVRAHLLHMPTVFQDAESAQLVTAGIATLKPSEGATLKQELAEPLVLQAVIEHLRTEGSRHEEILKELLFDSQDDASTFGKVTEYYVGWVSYQSLRKAIFTNKVQAFGGLLSKEDGIAHMAPKKRESFLKILDKAAAIPRSDEPLHRPTISACLGSLEKYTIDQPNQNIKNDVSLGSPKLKFHAWLGRILHPERKKYFPTFFFPSNQAGPDIVFCLRKRNKQDEAKRLLCAIQVRSIKHYISPRTLSILTVPKVKTGTTRVTRDDSFKVIRTLDPNLWFEGYENERKPLIQELRNSGLNLSILTLLVVTSAPVKKFFAGTEDLINGLAQLRDVVCTYSAEFDKAETDTEAEAKKSHEKSFEKAKRKVEKVAKAFCDKQNALNRNALVEEAARIIKDIPGPTKTASKPETQIRAALIFDEGFRVRFLRELNDRGLSEENDAVNELVQANITRDMATAERNKNLQNVKAELKEAAESILDGRPRAIKQHTASASAAGGKVLDFFFAVVEIEHLKDIFEMAFEQLVIAMKGLEQRKDVDAVEDSESDQGEDVGNEEAEFGLPFKRRKFNESAKANEDKDDKMEVDKDVMIDEDEEMD